MDNIGAIDACDENMDVPDEKISLDLQSKYNNDKASEKRISPAVIEPLNTVMNEPHMEHPIVQSTSQNVFDLKGKRKDLEEEKRKKICNNHCKDADFTSYKCNVCLKNYVRKNMQKVNALKGKEETSRCEICITCYKRKHKRRKRRKKKKLHDGLQEKIISPAETEVLNTAMNEANIVHPTTQLLSQNVSDVKRKRKDLEEEKRKKICIKHCKVPAPTRYKCSVCLKNYEQKNMREVNESKDKVDATSQCGICKKCYRQYNRRNRRKMTKLHQNTECGSRFKTNSFIDQKHHLNET